MFSHRICFKSATSGAKFEITQDFDDPIIDDYRRMLIANDIHVVGTKNIIAA
ncbi:hypothetical protein R0135_10565 [Congregibacter variabilis]|uniref:Uncharacterized protein n=1 Tax=Congregibacter variabilis TaxID=3081200 RepID=A0ABZ0HYB1_9GAMM|nr:hypothetical protein R0135_10565 [Congregibacter sp. IMCC43200]